MEPLIEKLGDWISESHYIVFFGGAGVSTESGIPDFRSADGVFNQKYPYPAEVMCSRSFFDSHTEAFFEFYRDKMVHPDAKPNPAHEKLAELEKTDKVKAVITQNIDGLHQAAGSKEVLELHGSVHRNTCRKCLASYPLSAVLGSVGVPKCTCGGTVKPDVVLYEEPLNQALLTRAVGHMQKADMVIVAGSSLSVYPAVGLLDYYHGNKLALINRSPTSYDKRADLLIADSVGKVLAQVKCWRGKEG